MTKTSFYPYFIIIYHYNTNTMPIGGRETLSTIILLFNRNYSTFVAS